MGQIEIKQIELKKVSYFPCVKCGSENIEFNDCGYSTFNVAWGKCKDCNNTVDIRCCDWNITTEKIIEYWNKDNNPTILREKYQNQINELQKLIDELPFK